MIPGLCLSLFCGADLLGRGFEAEGFHVVRGPDILWGQDVRSFTPARHAFEGVFGGSPCQDFSKARRDAPTGNGVAMLAEFARCVAAAAPEWFLLENVPGVPDIVVPGYTVQRFNLNAKEVGCAQNRLRCFQFGYRSGNPLVIDRGTPGSAVSRCAMASEGRRHQRRTWADFVELQGLPRDFDLPGLPIRTKYSLVGNGVPVPMARAVAVAVKLRNVTGPVQLCICDCGRRVRPGQTMAAASCRKRMQRRREARDVAAVTGPGMVTPAVSQLEFADPGQSQFESGSVLAKLAT